MPCDQVRTTTVQWNEGTDIKRLGEVLEKLGWTVRPQGAGLVASKREGYSSSRLVFSGGEMSFKEGTVDVDAMKQEYAVATLYEAEQYGWTVAEEGQEQKAIAGFTREW